jgi:hypothetical protein
VSAIAFAIILEILGFLNISFLKAIGISSYKLGIPSTMAYSVIEAMSTSPQHPSI